MANYPIISLSEQESVTLTILDLLNTFPDLPAVIKSKGISFYDMFPNLECMGLATQGSGIILKQFIGESYIGQINFRLQYRYSTKNSNARIQKQSLLSTIGEWINKKSIVKSDGTEYKLEKYPEIAEGKNILSIKSTSRTILVDKNLSGYEDSILDLLCTYHVDAISNDL